MNDKPASSRKRLEASSFNGTAELARPDIPYVWLLMDKLTSFRDNLNLLNVNNHTSSESSISEYVSQMSRLFANSSFFCLLDSIGNKFNVPEFDRVILEAYMRDYVMINCNITYRIEVDLAVKLFKREFDQVVTDKTYSSSLKYSLPLVHHVFDSCRVKLDTLVSLLSQFDPRLSLAKYLFLLNSFKSNYEK